MRPCGLVEVALALLGLTLPVCAAPLSLLSSKHLLRGRQSVPVPADDPFYTPPAGFASTSPGTVLRSRSIVASFFSDVPDPVEAWQLLYRTTAVNGSAIATVTTVFKPFNAMLDRFVSYATAYDSSATQCDPSYDYRLGSDSSDNEDTNEEFLIIEGYLLQGYIVASPDYEGPDAAFTPGHLEGMCVLDNMRAVTNFASTLGLSTDAPAIFGHGYSGGAIGTGWAASLQPSYAPELPVKGWAHGGTPANLTGVLLNVDNTEFSGYLPAAVAGLAAPSAYGAQLQPLLTQILTAKGEQAISYAKTHCSSDDLDEYAFISILSTDYQTLGPALLQQPTLSGILLQNIMGYTTAETPTAPVLVYHAKQDEIIPWNYTSELVTRWCDNDASVTFSTYEEGGHVTTAIVGVPEVYKYVASAFAGSITSGCTSNEYFTSVLDPIGLAVELEPILAKLIDILGNLGSGE